MSTINKLGDAERIALRLDCIIKHMRGLTDARGSGLKVHREAHGEV
ncbi:MULTISPECIES: hypothetical protein [Trinickia]|nr:hypothetical protein [Trinickia symbiotica]